jgi:hypothetical protein
MTAKRFYNKQRKPIILLVCEGRNKTERTYFEHFQTREAGYNLKIKDSESTDAMSMAKKADSLYSEYQMDIRLGDHVFCLLDLDLDPKKEEAYFKAKKKYKNIEFIVSNPCFEIWLQYYFTENPKVKSSSQAVKEQMREYVIEYTEATDIIGKYSLENMYAVAISRAEKKNAYWTLDQKLVERNPYTEVQNLVCLLLEIK